MIDSGRLNQIFKDCLAESSEAENTIISEGIVHSFAFNQTKIEKHSAEIKTMLNELPLQFHKDTGGGWSFLNMCMTKDGEQWTGLHLSQEQLMTLGMAIGSVIVLLPRGMWGILPGGMPYIQISI